MIQVFFSWISRLIAPSYCVSCQQFVSTREMLCVQCLDAIIPLVTKKIAITTKYSATIYSVSSYDEPLRSLVLAKQRGERLASVYLGKLVWQRTDIKFVDFDIIVPVPLHWSRYAWRWFNQADVMSQQISKLSGKPVVNLIKRIKKTQYQAGLRSDKRIENLKDAFVLRKDFLLYENKKILLIDDVMTTGATLNRCFAVLTKLRPALLVGGTACRVV
jgi:ComF family protein